MRGVQSGPSLTSLNRSLSRDPCIVRGGGLVLWLGGSVYGDGREGWIGITEWSVARA